MMRLTAVCAVLILGFLSSCVQSSVPTIGLVISSAETALLQDVDVTIYLDGKQQAVIMMSAGRYSNTVFSVVPGTTVCVTARYVNGSSINSTRGMVELVGQALPQLISVYDSMGSLKFGSVFTTPVNSCP